MSMAIEHSNNGCEHVTQSTLDSLKKKELSPATNPLFSSQYACLQCPAVGELRDLDNHFTKANHNFAYSAKNLYCAQCKDLVYDASMTPTAAKKRKLAHVPEEEEGYLLANTWQRPCGREGVRGLFNLGETCYMNAVLQMMVHNQLLSSYFLGMGHPVHTCPISNLPDKRVDSDSDEDDFYEPKTECKTCIACAFTDLFAESRMADQSVPAQAVNLLYASWKVIEHMAGKGQHDSQEWFMVIVDKLHETAKPSLDKAGRCHCFFHKVFFGRLYSEVTCDTCNLVSSTQEPFSSISLDFKKQAKKKKKALPDVKTPVPSIIECLQSYTAPEPLAAEEYKCQGCDMPQSATKRLRIRKLPAILCIHIKRFGMRQSNTSFIEEKYQGKIDFPFTLDMAPYVKGSGSDKTSEYVYDLESVIVHEGEMMSNGHYYAFCKQAERWYRFDDEIVSATTVEDVLRQEVYLLFYAARSVSTSERETRTTLE